MIRSVLKLTPTELLAIRNSLPSKSKQQKEVKKNFTISDDERAMLEELKEILEMFEFATDEIQTNEVSISRVFPCINFLKASLCKEGSYTYTVKMRKDLLQSLNERFRDYNENEVYLFSTFLDANFGVNAFSEEMKLIVKSKLTTFLKLESLKQQVSSEKAKPNVNPVVHPAVEKRKTNYIFYSNNETTSIESDSIEREIDEYIRILRSAVYDSPLQFWKINHSKFPLLSRVA
jgi:hypothetical protein